MIIRFVLLSVSIVCALSESVYCDGQYPLQQDCEQLSQQPIVFPASFSQEQQVLMLERIENIKQISDGDLLKEFITKTAIDFGLQCSDIVDFLSINSHLISIPLTTENKKDISGASLLSLLGGGIVALLGLGAWIVCDYENKVIATNKGGVQEKPVDSFNNSMAARVMESNSSIESVTLSLSDANGSKNYDGADNLQNLVSKNTKRRSEKKIRVPRKNLQNVTSSQLPNQQVSEAPAGASASSSTLISAASSSSSSSLSGDQSSDPRLVLFQSLDGRLLPRVQDLFLLVVNEIIKTTTTYTDTQCGPGRCSGLSKLLITADLPQQEALHDEKTYVKIIQKEYCECSALCNRPIIMVNTSYLTNVPVDSELSLQEQKNSQTRIIPNLIINDQLSVATLFLYAIYSALGPDCCKDARHSIASANLYSNEINKNPLLPDVFCKREPQDFFGSRNDVNALTGRSRSGLILGHLPDEVCAGALYLFMRHHGDIFQKYTNVRDCGEVSEAFRRSVAKELSQFKGNWKAIYELSSWLFEKFLCVYNRELRNLKSDELFDEISGSRHDKPVEFFDELPIIWRTKSRLFESSSL